MGKLTFRIEAIVPKDNNMAAIFKAAYRHALDLVANEIQRDFEDVTRTWKHKPKFTIRVTERGGQLGITISTKDVIFMYVNYGTKAHVIRPKKAKRLTFQVGYSAKSTPGFIGSKVGGASGAFVSAQEVHHPGTEARKFDVAIARRRQKSLQSKMDTALAKAARKANAQR